MADYSWHEDFYTRKVFPQVCKDAGECSGFFAWLQVSDRQLYDELTRLEHIINDIWSKAGDRQQFRSACREWYAGVMAGINKWRHAMSQPALQPKPKQEVLL